MATTAADVLIDTIHDWGVEVVFGLPGNGTNGIMEALRQRQEKIRFVQVRHEESAAFMACAYAKFTGRLGVCLATSGPGGLHLLNGLYDAKLDGQPVLALTGLPYAIAAQAAHPQRQCVAFVGDGGFSMLMAEFATAVKYKLPIKVVVLTNNTLGMIKWEQMVFLGNPEYGCELQPIDFATFARACGGAGFTVEDPADCGRALDEALAAPGPVIVNALVDPFEPPMPPKVTLEQAAHFAQALIRGEPNREKIVLTVLADKVRELV